MKINLSGITIDSIVDGPGLRTTIFTQGCPHGCVGCHNPETWSFKENQLKDTDKLISEILSGSNKAVTFSGGEPFSQAEACYEIARVLEENNFNLWSYSGFTFEQLLNGSKYQQKFLKTLNVLVDGPFVLSKKSLSLKYKGSSNQRIIDVQQSLKQNKVVELQLDNKIVDKSPKLYI